MKHNDEINLLVSKVAPLAHDVRNLVQILVLCLDQFRLARQQGEREQAAVSALTTLRRLKALLAELGNAECPVVPAAGGDPCANAAVPPPTGPRDTAAPAGDGDRCDAAAVLRAVVEGHRQTAPRAVSVHADLPPGPLWVLMAAVRLDQVASNLVRNAVQAVSPAGGRVTMGVRAGTDAAGAADVEITVSDTGPGIPAEVRDRIFEDGFTTKPLGEGNGLGLATVRRLVGQCGGTLTFTSNPAGTAFLVHLPTGGGR